MLNWLKSLFGGKKKSEEQVAPSEAETPMEPSMGEEETSPEEQTQ